MKKKVYEFYVYSKKKKYKILIDYEDMWIFKYYNIYIFNREGKYKNDLYAYCTKRGKRERILLHRLIIKAKEHEIVDHENNNTLDNRNCNLRITDPTGNARNRLPGKFFKGKKQYSKYKGVTRRKKTNGTLGRWTAAIKANSKSIHLGDFSDEIDAASAYDKAALKYHGEFAKLNFSNKKEVKRVRLVKR